MKLTGDGKKKIRKGTVKKQKKKRNKGLETGTGAAN